MPEPVWHAALQELRDQQRATEEKVNLQQERIDELSQQLLTLKTKAENGQQVPEQSVPVPVDEEEKAANNMPEEEEGRLETAIYQFEESMWDASLLLFLGRPTLVDTLVLLVGTAMNVGLQFLLLWVVYKNMLDNPYDEETVESMVDWRVSTAQADFTPSQGATTTLAWRLCTLQLWSYEQAEYEEMHNYLYKPVPGIWLSLLAIILWILTCLREYRICLEQFLAVLNLPVVGHQRHSLRVREREDSIQVVGIGRLQKIMALLFLCLLRLFVIGVLSVVGCSWLARTVSLNDIVLNAVALAFVLDVDEGLCVVVLSQRLRSKLSKMEPISCGAITAKYALWGVSFKDVFRYVLFGILLSTTIVVWLVPFRDHVESAALALCGGDTNFTYSGGNFFSQEVLIKPLVEDRYKVGCHEDEALTAQYISSYYPGVLLNSSARGESNETEERRSEVESRLLAVRREAVIKYAFRSCGPGEVRSPATTGDNSDDSWACRPAPEALMQATEMAVGGLEEPPPCSVLDVASASCEAPEFPVCTWPKEAEVCEPADDVFGGAIRPPGGYHATACREKGVTMRKQCEQWSYFGSVHPTKNCKAVEVCSEDFDVSVHSDDCFSFQASMNVTVGNVTVFENTSISLEAVTQAIRYTIPELQRLLFGLIVQQEVYVSLVKASHRLKFRVRRWPFDLKDRQWQLDAEAIKNRTNYLLWNQTGVPDVVESMHVINPEYTSWSTIYNQRPSCTSTSEIAPSSFCKSSTRRRRYGWR